MKLALILLAVVALVAYACARQRRSVPVVVDLDGIAEMQLRADLRLDSRETEQTGDRSTFHFRRVNDTHINGQTSYAEFLTVSLLAEDLPVAESLTMEETVYEQHPVKEPAWRVKLVDAKAGVSLEWMGYRKQYNADHAKEYVREMAAGVRWKKDRAEHFAAHRDWSTSGWAAAYQENLRLLHAALASKGLPAVVAGRWTRHGEWRYTIDNERPQRFHLVRAVAHIALPDGPFRLLAPLTYFRYYATRGFWHQDNQGHGGGVLPASVLPGFREEWTNQEHVYFYCVQSLQLWKEYPSLAHAVRELMEEAGRRVEEFHTKGAIDADAEG
ncbi:MAG: hypothetical protein JST93_15020 [Acidobacteria bacterium]|nr:hypothetical protein [Acidobacteriota bacterium]